MGFWDSVYDGAATVGTIDAWFSMGATGIIAIFGVIIGALLLFTSFNPAVGKDKSTLPPSQKKTYGVVMSALSVVLVGFALLNLALTRAYKPYAALGGAMRTGSIVSSLWS